MLAGLRDRYRRRQRTLEAFFASLPTLSRWRLAAVVFFCFAPTGLLGGLWILRPTPWPHLAIATIYSGGLAVLYGASAVSRRRRVWLPIAVLVNVVSMILLRQLLNSGSTPPASLGPGDVVALRSYVFAVSMAVLVSTVLAYIFFVQLFQSEGRRFVHAQSEIQLASDIHAALVPALSGTSGKLEWRGVSRASGAVGGDLVDVQDDAHGWFACVADVSGHGVPAGLLMGMFKTAVRSMRSEDADVASVLTRVNRILGPLKQSNMFVTAAVLRRRSAHDFEYVLAGHPRLLHVHSRTGSSTWVGESQLAIGLVDNVTYRACVLTLEPGDLLAVVTDGLLEVFDRRDREFGIDGVLAAVSGLARAPLTDIESRVFDAAARHGQQLDDQTLLLIRV